jgi:hypothetical protein
VKAGLGQYVCLKTGAFDSYEHVSAFEMGGSQEKLVAEYLMEQVYNILIYTGLDGINVTIKSPPTASKQRSEPQGEPPFRFSLHTTEWCLF